MDIGRTLRAAIYLFWIDVVAYLDFLSLFAIESLTKRDRYLVDNCFQDSLIGSSKFREKHTKNRAGLVPPQAVCFTCRRLNRGNHLFDDSSRLKLVLRLDQHQHKRLAGTLRPLSLHPKHADKVMLVDHSVVRSDARSKCPHFGFLAI